MTGKGKAQAAVVGAVVLLGLISAGLISSAWIRKPLTLHGAVITRDVDTRKELPISGVTVSAFDGATLIAEASSVSSGDFNLTLPKDVRRGHPISLRFRQATYFPL